MNISARIHEAKLGAQYCKMTPAATTSVAGFETPIINIDI
jgi:hypothetical protein